MCLRLAGICCAFAIAGCDSLSSKKGPFEEGRILGVNENRDLEETSGLAASRLHPGMFWAHNDGGHPPEIFLLDSTGQTVASFRVAGAKNRDWEDIAIAPGSDNGATLFIGDIGDNRERHPTKKIYCVQEPALGTSAEVPVTDTLVFRLRDGSRDSECLLVDPHTRSIYIVTKLENSVHVYEITYPYPKGTFELTQALRLPVRHITAGDISPDGTEILLKNYTTIYYWKRSPGQSVIQALQQEPTELPYEQEPQGESIAWAADGTGYYTLSENGKGQRGRLIFYARTPRPDTTTTVH